MSRQMRLTVAFVAALVLVFGAVAMSPANASVSTQLQTAQDQLANCKLLAANSTGAQRDRAQACVTDQTRIIKLLGGVTPSPTVAPTTPGSTPTVNPTTPPATTAPPTTPPATTGPVVGCAVVPSKCGYPDAGTTGVPADVKLTAMSGDQTIRTAGTVIDGADIAGCVTIEADNVVIRDSRITCRGAYGIRSFAGNTGTVVEDSTVSCAGTSATGIAATGTYRRVDVSGCENGFSIWADTTIEDSWIHGLALVGAGHVDGIQINDGSRRITIRHSTIRNDHDQTSAIIGDTGTHTDILIERNLLIGGGYTLYCAMAPTDYQVRDNRITGGHFGPWVYCDRAQVNTGNVDDAGKALVP